MLLHSMFKIALRVSSQVNMLAVWRFCRYIRDDGRSSGLVYVVRRRSEAAQDVS